MQDRQDIHIALRRWTGLLLLALSGCGQGDTELGGEESTDMLLTGAVTTSFQDGVSPSASKAVAGTTINMRSGSSGRSSSSGIWMWSHHHYCGDDPKACNPVTVQTYPVDYVASDPSTWATFIGRTSLPSNCISLTQVSGC